MHILITGGQGQLGRALTEMLATQSSALGQIPGMLHGARVTAVDMAELDISLLEPTLDFVKRLAPDVIIHCAAYTNVDGCEQNPDLALRVNALGTRNVAMAAQSCGAKLIALSTDYVFSGEGATPYGEWDLCAPQSIYGKSKWLGEQYALSVCSRTLIVRTAWLYGLYGKNFVKTMCRLAREKGRVQVVNDQVGSPTNAEDLAYHLLKLACSQEYGIYHICGQGQCSWYDFAREIFRLGGIPCTVTPCDSATFPSPVKRPAYSVLDHGMLRATVGDQMRPWAEALQDYMAKWSEISKEEGAIP